MKYTEQNAQTFNNWKQKYGLFWMEPIDHETFLKAVGGEWDITLTPVRKVPHAWLGDLTGKRVLGLAAGGGQQMPILTARGANCTVLLGSDRQEVWDFYVRKLGYRPVRRSGESDEESGYLMLQLGQSRIEVRCDGREEIPAGQTLCISAAGLSEIRKRLAAQGIDPGEYQTDPYTGRRELRFTGPDNVQILMTEAE